LQPVLPQGEPRPRDGGFGQEGSLEAGFGDGRFNTPPVGEAADTGPFFHNNSVDTIEGAVTFYNTGDFNNSPSGPFVGGIFLTGLEVRQIGAFLRAINSLENIRSAIDCEERAKKLKKAEESAELLELCISDIQDAIEVLKRGPGPADDLNPDAADDLQVALDLSEDAVEELNKNERNELIEDAIAALVAARSGICVAGTETVALLCP